MSKINWKNVISLLVIIAILALLVYAFFFYRHIENTKTDYFDKTETFVLAETELETIDNMYHFQEESSYYILEGKDKQGKQWLVFNPGKNKDPDELEMYELDELVTKKQVEKAWHEDCQECTLKKSSPAMIDETPLWELTYLDENDRYVMEYISMEDGSTFERLKMNRKHNKKG